jgi:DNA invertase Pin-like site-specific DNA recombinase
MPEANDLTVGLMALMAQQERDAISRRTKEALAVAKAREVGQPEWAAALKRAGRRDSAVAASCRSGHLINLGDFARQST